MINQPNLNSEVTKFLDDSNHPLRNEIEKLRLIIMNSVENLSENIKWNGPNYSFQDSDRITLKIQPPKQIQVIFHRGVQKQLQPAEKLINDESGILVWRENDRAIASFKNLNEIEKVKTELGKIVKDWIKATK